MNESSTGQSDSDGEACLPGADGRRPLSLGRCVGAGLLIGVIGSVTVGVVECAMATIAVVEQLAGDRWPIALVLAAVGKITITHLMLWCPTLVLVGLLYWWALRRRGTRAPEPALAAVFVVLAGWVVVPTDLEIIRRATPTLLGIAYGGAALAGLVSYLVGRWLFAGPRTRAVRRIMATLAVAAALLTVVTGVCFARSPLFDSQAYRLGRGEVRQSATSRPNVLWIVLDTVRADRMSCYGYAQPTTPFLEEWAAQSLVFDRALANGIWTVPSHASMFTGLPVRQHGTDYRNTWLEDSFPTVADRLGAEGYATAMFSNNPWLSRDTNLAKGFDTCRVAYHLRHITRFSLEFLCEKWGITPPVPWLDSDFGAALTNQWVARWLDRHAYGEQPFFLYVNYLDAHLPYRVPRRYRRMFLSEAEVHRSYDLRRNVYGDLVSLLDLKFNIEGPQRIDPADRKVARGQYLAGIRYLDDRVRELFDSLEQRDLLDNTLVIVTSDHGENLGHHDMWGHRFLAYNSLAHVALMIREPGRRRGRRIFTPVQLSDLFPTVLNATIGGEGNRDLLRLAADGGADRIAVIEYSAPEISTVKSFMNRGAPWAVHRTEPQIAACDGRFKYMASNDGTRELYDLSVDPGEENNLIETLPDEAGRLAAYLDGWQERVPTYEPSRAGAVPPMSPQVIEALRSLGYIDDD